MVPGSGQSPLGGAFQRLLQIAWASDVDRWVLAQPTRTAVYGPVRTVVWQGSAGDRRPYADLVGKQEVGRPYHVLRTLAVTRRLTNCRSREVFFATRYGQSNPVPYTLNGYASIGALATAHKTHTGVAIRAVRADCADRGISKLLITGPAEWFNSVPGHHYFQWFSRPARNFTPVISHLWSLTAPNFPIADDMPGTVQVVVRNSRMDALNEFRPVLARYRSTSWNRSRSRP